MLLGVHIQGNLKWTKQIEALKQKLKKRLAGLQMLKFIVPFSALKTVVNGIFTSTLVYCLPLFGGCDRKDVNCLQVMQNKAAQIVTKAPLRTHRSQMFDKLEWMTVNQLIAYHTVMAVFRIRDSGHPEYLASILKRESRMGKILLPRYQLELADKSFSVRGARLWNLLPDRMRNMDKISTFKIELKKWTMENISRFLD